MRVIFLLFFFLNLVYADRDGGPYIGIGYAQVTIDDNGIYTNKQEKDKIARFEVGAYINKYLSVALEYYLKADFDGVSFGVGDINTQAHYQFYHNNLDCFLKFGAGEVATDVTSGFALVYGGGISYRFSTRYSIKIGYDYVDIGVDTTGNDAVDKHINLSYTYGALEVQF